MVTKGEPGDSSVYWAALRRGISGDTSSCSFDLVGDSVCGVKVVVVSGCIGFLSLIMLPHGKKSR